MATQKIAVQNEAIKEKKWLSIKKSVGKATREMNNWNILKKTVIKQDTDQNERPPTNNSVIKSHRVQ